DFCPAGAHRDQRWNSFTDDRPVSKRDSTPSRARRNLSDSAVPGRQRTQPSERWSFRRRVLVAHPNAEALCGTISVYLGSVLLADVAMSIEVSEAEGAAEKEPPTPVSARHLDGRDGHGRRSASSADRRDGW